jgi:all-trans-retinol 13,14-reductase
MSSQRVIIIGAGFGGLLCGRILSRRGFDVILLEQGRQYGGALQTFVREGVRFDTGFHSVGGLAPYETLELIFRPLGLMELPWYRTEPDEIIGGDNAFLRLSSGWKEEKKHVLAPFRLSTWRLKGGGKTLADELARDQQVLLRKKVVSIEDHVVTCEDGTSYRGDFVIAAIHPQLVLQLLKDRVRPAYRKRINRLPNGPGIVTVNAKLRPGAMKYINHSIFIDNQVMIHFGEPDENGFAPSVDLLGFAPTNAEKLIRKASQRLPDLPQAIEKYWVSTPETWEYFTGTPEGTAYGILKNAREDFLPPVTPLPWLFLTGQNLGLHGILGTAVSAIYTCKSIQP